MTSATAATNLPAAHPANPYAAFRPQRKSAPASIRDDILDRLAGPGEPRHVMVIPRPLLRLCGNDRNAALLLNQLLYWSDRTSDPEGWFSKSADDWQAELGLSRYQVKRVLEGDRRVKSGGLPLTALGVETKLARSPYHGHVPTTHYRVNRQHLQAAIGAHRAAQPQPATLNTDPPAAGVQQVRRQALPHDTVNKVDNPPSTRLQTGVEQCCKPDCNKVAIPTRARGFLTEITTKTTYKDKTLAPRSGAGAPVVNRPSPVRSVRAAPSPPVATAPPRSRPLPASQDVADPYGPAAGNRAIVALLKARLEATGAINPHALKNRTDREYARSLHRAGVTAQDIHDFVGHRRREAYWKHRPISLRYIAECIQPWKEEFAARKPRFGFPAPTPLTRSGPDVHPPQEPETPPPLAQDERPRLALRREEEPEEQRAARARYPQQTEEWRLALCQLKIQLASCNFETWLYDTVLLDYERTEDPAEPDRFTIGARNDVACGHLQHRLNRSIRRILRDVHGRDVTLQFRALPADPVAVSAGRHGRGVTMTAREEDSSPVLAEAREAPLPASNTPSR